MRFLCVEIDVGGGTKGGTKGGRTHLPYIPLLMRRKPFLLCGRFLLSWLLFLLWVVVSDGVLPVGGGPMEVLFLVFCCGVYLLVYAC